MGSEREAYHRQLRASMEASGELGGTAHAPMAEPNTELREKVARIVDEACNEFEAVAFASARQPVIERATDALASLLSVEGGGREEETRSVAESGGTASPKSEGQCQSVWRPIASAPTDGTRFLALQGSEVWRAYGQINPNTGQRYFVRRTHERAQGRGYRHMDLEIDGVWDTRKVLIHEEPDDYRFHWCSWSRGFDFSPTHWMPLPPPPSEGA